MAVGFLPEIAVSYFPGSDTRHLAYTGNVVVMLLFTRIRQIALGLCLAGLMPAGAQNSGVVVLDESDFEKAPDAAPVSAGGLRGGGSPAASANGEVHHFDPRRDAKADIQRALEVAARENKRVLLEVGGDWCPFCKVLDRFFEDHADILAFRRRNFVYVKVNFSEENRNEEALVAYPLIRGFPHFYVLDARGKMLISQRVALLGTQTGYSPERFRAFLERFSPARR